MCNEIIALHIGMESGVVLRKDPLGEKDWTERDLKKMFKKGYLYGYDPNYAMQFSCHPVDCMCSVYMREANEEDEIDDGMGSIETTIFDKGIMYK